MANRLVPDDDRQALRLRAPVDPVELCVADAARRDADEELSTLRFGDWQAVQFRCVIVVKRHGPAEHHRIRTSPPRSRLCRTPAAGRQRERRLTSRRLPAPAPCMAANRRLDDEQPAERQCQRATGGAGHESDDELEPSNVATRLRIPALFMVLPRVGPCAPSSPPASAGPSPM